MEKLGNIAIIGGGSWATAIAKIVLTKKERINWYMYRQDRIDSFKVSSHNPAYLTNVSFDVKKINFNCNVSECIKHSDTLIFAIPSPFLKKELNSLSVSLKNKLIISAVKGIIPKENLIVSDFFIQKHEVNPENIAVIAGPCHAEEVARNQLSYLTISCSDLTKADFISNLLTSDYIQVTTNKDVAGVEYSSVLKNIYAIAAGIYHGLTYGDNFLAAFIANCIQEMNKFLNKVYPLNRNICDSVYLGDVLVTGYSKYSRNRSLGYLIGQGHSVEGALSEMNMVAEGYYGTKCIYELNKKYNVNMPILNTVYAILHNKANALLVMKKLTYSLR